MGKSHLIRALYQAAVKHYNSRAGENFNEVKILLLAPTGNTASGSYYEHMESPSTLLRSSKASMTTLPAVLVMVTSYLKFTLVSGRGV